jgi:methionine synthase II (cobalamin-independent)
MPVRTTVVGSWWIYPEDAADLRAYHDGNLSKQASDAVLNRVASKAIAEQRTLDLDEWSGGEYFTDEFILHMYKSLTGLQVDKPQEAVVFVL